MDKKTVTVAELMRMLGVGRNTAYALVNRSDFPTVRIGKSIRIPLDALDAWLQNQASGSKGQDRRGESA